MAKLPTQPTRGDDGNLLNPTRRPHLSLSALDDYVGCSWQYKLKRVDRLGAGDSYRFALGRALHKVAEICFQRKIDAGTLPPLEDARALFVAALSRELGTIEASGAEWSPDVLRDYGTPRLAIDGMTSRGIYAVTEWLRWAQGIEPISVEHPFRVRLNAPFDLVGVIDLVRLDRHGGRTDLVIGDYKFRASSFNVRISEWHGAEMYALGWASRNEGKLPAAEELVTVHVNIKSARVAREIAVRTPKQIESFVAFSLRVAAMIGADDFRPDPLLRGETWRCRNCAVSSDCEFFQKFSAGEFSFLDRWQKVTYNEWNLPTASERTGTDARSEEHE